VLLKTATLALTAALLITLLLVTFLPSLKADTGKPQVQWDKTYGPKDGYCAFQTADGGFAIAGREAVWDASHLPGGWENATSILIKVNNSGYEQWRKSFGREGEGTIGINSVLQTEDNGYVLAGYKAVSSGDTGISEVSSFFWLAKTDDEGNVQWNKTYLGPVYTASCVAIQTKDNGYALAGYTQSLEVNNDAWLVKTDAEGNMQWSRTYGLTNYDRFYSIVETDDGGYAMTGMTLSPEAGSSWLVKTDSEGKMEWSKTYGTGQEGSSQLIKTSDKSYLMVGERSDSDEGGSYGWVVKTDLQGNKKWDLTYKEKNGFFQSVVEAYDGGCVFGGRYWGDYGDLEGAWLVKVTSSGFAEWQVLYAGDGTKVSSLIKTDDGGYAFTGTKEGVSSQSKIWFVKISPDSIPHETELAAPEPPKHSYETWIAIAAIIVATGLSLGLLLYFKKRRTRS
jgi:hypothetical protein